MTTPDERDLEYPLAWPVGWPRAKVRSSAPFHIRGARLTIGDGLDRVQPELERLGARDVIVSTNVRPRLHHTVGEAADPGVAVYFRLERGGERKVLACDKWSRVADNLAAIAAHVEALRGQQRWGVGTLAQAFAGYKALEGIRNWWEVLGVPPDATAARIKARRRELLEKHHPDKGGDPAQAAEINGAYDRAVRSGAVAP